MTDNNPSIDAFVGNPEIPSNIDVEEVLDEKKDLFQFQIRIEATPGTITFDQLREKIESLVADSEDLALTSLLARVNWAYRTPEPTVVETPKQAWGADA